MAPSSRSNQLVATLRHALVAYDQAYGLPADAADRQAVVGALLCSLPDGAAMVAAATPKAQIVDTVVDTVVNTDPTTIATTALTTAHSALAAAAHQRRQQLVTDLRGTLDAYVQQCAPAVAVDDLHTALEAAIPLVSGGPITAAEARSLIRQVTPTLQAALPSEVARAVEVGGHSLELAQTLAQVLRQRPFEQAVCETVTAYGQHFQDQAVAIGEELIENAIEAILRNQRQFGFEFDIDLSLTDRQLMVQQVSFKLNILQASPPPSKTALEIAQQIHSEVERFRAERAAALGTDGAAGLVSEDGMSIASGWRFEDRSADQT